MTVSESRGSRKPIRLKRYDYSTPGAYFVTTCVQDRLCLFGEVSDEEIRVNDAGRMIEEWWLELPNKFTSVQAGEFVVMPNHIHGIVTLVGADLCVRPGQGAHAGAPLPTIMQWFKTMTTNAYIRGVKQSRWEPFSGKLWQRNYYEHIIRNEHELNSVREYIANNPLQWALDRENPQVSCRVNDTKYTAVFGAELP